MTSQSKKQFTPRFVSARLYYFLCLYLEQVGSRAAEAVAGLGTLEAAEGDTLAVEGILLEDAQGRLPVAAGEDRLDRGCTHQGGGRGHCRAGRGGAW